MDKKPSPSYAEFYEAIKAIAARGEETQTSLFEYLLALLKLVKEREKKRLDFELLCEILEAAFTAKGAEFNPAWLDIKEPPQNEIWTAKFTNPELNLSSLRKNSASKEDATYALSVIKFQCAELERMRASGDLNDPQRWLGIVSPSGNQWYNFTPESLLECGAAGIMDGAEDENEAVNISWASLGELLEIGRIYE